MDEPEEQREKQRESRRKRSRVRVGRRKNQKEEDLWEEHTQGDGQEDQGGHGDSHGQHVRCMFVCGLYRRPSGVMAGLRTMLASYWLEVMYNAQHSQGNPLFWRVSQEIEVNKLGYTWVYLCYN